MVLTVQGKGYRGGNSRSASSVGLNGTLFINQFCHNQPGQGPFFPDIKACIPEGLILPVGRRISGDRPGISLTAAPTDLPLFRRAYVLPLK